MTNINFRLIKLAIFIIAGLSLSSSLGSYLSQLGNERVLGPLSYALIICFLSALVQYNYLKIPIFILILSWIIYFHMIIPVIITTILITAIFKIGEYILNLFGVVKKSIFIVFCLGHTSIAFLLWLIIRFSGYNAIDFYKLIGYLVFGLGSFSFVKIIINQFNDISKNKIKLNQKNNVVLIQAITIVGLSLLIYATLYSFYFDDINGYMYAPLRVFYDGGFIFGPDRPGFMTNMSALSLGYGGLLSAFLGYDRELFIMTFKLFHASSYLVGIITFIISIKYAIDSNLKGFAVILLGLLPLTIFEITGNYADYYVLLVSFYIFYSYFCNIFLKVNYEPKYFYINSLLIGLFLIVSLKTIPYIFSSFIIAFIYFLSCELVVKKGIFSLVKRNKISLILNFLLVLFPISVLFIDNFIKSGNPTFPGGNGLWKSPYFSLGGLVAGRFHFPNMPDGTTFLQVFSFTPQASQLFSSGNSYFPIYGIFSQTIIYLIPFLILFIVIKYKNSNHCQKTLTILVLSLLFIIVTFVSISIIVGPQHRYFYGVTTYLFMAFIIAVSKVKFHSLSKTTFNILKWFFFLLASFSFFGNGIEPPPFKISSERLLLSTVNGDKWISKRSFYDKVNQFIRDDKAIMLSYLQDKFFIDSKFVYELDWYDFPIQSQINDIWNSSEYPSVELKLIKINKYLCDKNFRYFILSKGAIIYHPFFNEMFLKKTEIYDDYQSLNILACPK